MLEPSKSKKKVVLKIEAILELNADDFTHLDKVDVEKLEKIYFEIQETKQPVELKQGISKYRGHIRFITPTPYELKLARLKNTLKDSSQ